MDGVIFVVWVWYICLSGGIPHCFPQFGPGKIQQHGFARNVSWEICSTGSECGSAFVVLTLMPNSYSKCMWNYDFLLTYKAAISVVQVKGVKGCRFLTKDKVPVKGCEQRDSITFTSFYDCLYFCAPNELQLHNGLGTTVGIQNHGWTDAVMWSPMDQIASWKDFVCVENAVTIPPNTFQVCVPPNLAHPNLARS